MKVQALVLAREMAVKIEPSPGPSGFLARHLYGKESTAGHSSRGTRILRSGEVGAAVGARLAAVGVVVHRPTAGEVRKRLVDRAIKGEARTNALAVAVRAGFPSWPATDDDTHRRDGGALVLAAALPPRAPRAASPRASRSAPAGPRPKRDRSGMRRPGREREQEASRIERAALGCICKTKRSHDCPYHFPSGPPPPKKPAKRVKGVDPLDVALGLEPDPSKGVHS